MKILRGTIFGSLAFFALGWLVWGILLMDFSMTNYDQNIYLPEDEMVWWALIFSNLILALFLTLFMKWGQAKTILDGMRIGIIFGVLYALSIDLGYYSMTTVILSPIAIVVDTLAYAFVTAITGLVIILTWGKEIPE